MAAEVVERLVRCELERFAVDACRGLPEAPAFEIVSGAFPALVSAPHAVTQMRDGKPKPSEDFTGPIALELARRLGCHAMAATRTSDGDPNRDAFERCAYKRALVDHVDRCGVVFVLDLHGMVAASPALMALGTSDGLTTRNLPGFDGWALGFAQAQLAQQIERYGRSVVLNDRFAARGESTIARTVARMTGAAALQVELATQVRVPNWIWGRIGSDASTRDAELRPRDVAPAEFSDTGLGKEVSARRSPDPAAVLAAIDVLAEIIACGVELVAGAWA